MAAEQLCRNGVKVDIYDAMPSVARKFLRAGIGGLNITHSEPMDQFIQRYGDAQDIVAQWFDQFSPQQLRQWCDELGIATFVGSSGRVFPEQKKAAPLLRRWLSRLRQQGVEFHLNHRWTGWHIDGRLQFIDHNRNEPVYIKTDALVLALGGGSWKKLGSDGQWQSLLAERNIAVSELQPSNCGFNIAWSDYFIDKFAGQAIKSVALSVADINGVDGQAFSKGEMVVSRYGLEGSLIYAHSRCIRERLQQGRQHIVLDLLPDLSSEAIQARLQKTRGKESLSSYLRKRLNISGVKYALLRECFDPQKDINQSSELIAAIKQLTITIQSPRPIDEAISTAGGVCFSELNADLMLSKLPGVFVAGEMLDWDAPTGGYLLSACYASGVVAGQGALRWLRS